MTTADCFGCADCLLQSSAVFTYGITSPDRIITIFDPATITLSWRRLPHVAREVLGAVAAEPVALGVLLRLEGQLLVGRLHRERDMSALSQHCGVHGRRERRAPCRFYQRHKAAQLEPAALGIDLLAFLRRLPVEQHRQRRASDAHAVAEHQLDAAEMSACTRVFWAHAVGCACGEEHNAGG